MKLEKDFLRNPDLGLLIVRLSTGGLMLFHGVHKAAFGVNDIRLLLAMVNLPPSLAYGAVFCEMGAAMMIVTGLWTRLAAAVLAANMVVAILLAHLPVFFTTNEATGAWAVELPMLYLLPALALCLTGGGRYAMTTDSILD